MSFKLGEFGIYQKLFDKRIKQNEGFIEKLNVTRSETGPIRYFEMLFIPKVSKKNLVKYWFRVRFEQYEEVQCRTILTVCSNENEYELKSQDNMRYDQKYSDWLVDVLFKIKYNYKQISLILPHRLDWDGEPIKNEIREIRIRIDNEDSDIANSWLSKFPSPTELLHITSNQFRFKLEDSLILRESIGLKICGNVDFDLQFIKNLNWTFFIHRSGAFKEFTLEEMQELWEYCYGSKNIRAISLQQSTEKNGKKLIDWIREKYGRANVNYSEYYVGRKENETPVYYCKHLQKRIDGVDFVEVKFGVFDSLDEAELDSEKWSTEINPNEVNRRIF